MLICNVPHIFKISAEASVSANLCKAEKKCLYANGGRGCKEVLLAEEEHAYIWSEVQRLNQVDVCPC